MNFSLYVGLSVGTGGGVAGVSFTGRPGTSILMLNLRLYRSTSSAGGGGGVAGGRKGAKRWHRLNMNSDKASLQPTAVYCSFM